MQLSNDQILLLSELLIKVLQEDIQQKNIYRKNQKETR